ncbi:MAG: hypothetical protein HOP28_05355 [Gemmatimonadales bacterium]|nr:hypothetical protein [Gemmatimonadales bacterium]
MTSAMPMETTQDQTDVPNIVRAGVKLGLFQSVLIGAFAVLQVRLSGMAELAVCGLIFVVGVAATIVLPGTWTKARTIEGIAGAAGVGLASAIVFMLVDVTLFQPLHLWTNRWLEIGGGANWWYHPVWWMAGSYMPWMGAWVLANQAAKTGTANPLVLVIGTLALAAVSLAVGVVVGVPGAGWNLGSFAVAVLPGQALYTILSSFGVRRR